MELSVTRDEVVLQRPEDVHFQVPVFHTATACAGAATAYLLRRIAYRAGAYAPGIQEYLFHELNSAREGGSLEKVQRWFSGRSSAMADLGYRLQCRRVATPTDALLDWVKQGRGYRGAMLPTSFVRLHPGSTAGDELPNESVAHAVGVTMEKLAAKGDDQLVMLDPWPGIGGDGTATDRGKLPTTLEAAHRDRNFHALIYYWSGWS